MSEYRWIDVELVVARSVTEESLSAGGPLSQLQVRQLDRFDTATVAVPADYRGTITLDGFSRGFNLSLMRRALVERLGAFRAQSRQVIVVVEDDVRRASDDISKLRHVDVIGDRLLHWIAVDADPADVDEVVRDGATGYPFNGAVTSHPPSRHIDAASLERLVESTSAIVTAVFDAESYLVLSRSA